MDADMLSKKMKALYTKASDARKKGKAEVAKSFRAGARRIQRDLKALKAKAKAAPKTEEAAAPTAG